MMSPAGSEHGVIVAEIAGILSAQWPLGDKAARGEYVVDNRGPLAETRKRVQEIWTELQKIGKSS